jgi:VanZ family protein
MTAPRRLGPWLEAWSPVFLYTGLIFTLSSIPTLAPPGGVPVEDKIWHLLEYGGWALLVRRALDRPADRAGERWLKGALSVLLAAALSVADENFQRSVGRQYSTLDMAADAAGALLAQPLYELLRRPPRRAGASRSESEES